MKAVSQTKGAKDLPKDKAARDEQHWIEQDQRPKFPWILQSGPQGDNCADGMSYSNNRGRLRCKKLQQIARKRFPALKLIRLRVLPKGTKQHSKDTIFGSQKIKERLITFWWIAIGMEKVKWLVGATEIKIGDRSIRH